MEHSPPRSNSPSNNYQSVDYRVGLASIVKLQERFVKAATTDITLVETAHISDALDELITMLSFAVQNEFFSVAETIRDFPLTAGDMLKSLNFAVQWATFNWPSEDTAKAKALYFELQDIYEYYHEAPTP